ncbi:MAG: 30S ribosomal protein S21 [Dehalococcoidales bacterium]|nr:30S ribosomal protein S21 [Dehalococcoidales bacterium]
MTDVTAGDNEDFESLLKRFNKRVRQSGILSEMKHGSFFEKPSVKRNKKETRKRKSSRLHGNNKE